jgi:drug/metabolite transporter (DMT)-like permease
MQRSLTRAADRWLAHAAALVTIIAWASAFVGIRAAGEDLSPGPLSVFRLAVGALALGAVVALRRERLPARRDLPRLAVCGVLWFGVYNIALNAAERRVDAGTAAMLVNVGPIVLALLAGFLLGEGFPRRLLSGCAIAFGGVTLIAFGTSDGVVLSGGALLCLLAAVMYAGGVVAQKPLLARSSSLVITWGASIAGLAVCLPFAPALIGEIGDASPESIAWALYLGLVPTAIAFTTWAYALARTTAGRMGATTYLVPPVAILLGWAFLGETPPLLALAGGALALAGVVVVRR